MGVLEYIRKLESQKEEKHQADIGRSISPSSADGAGTSTTLYLVSLSDFY